MPDSVINGRYVVLGELGKGGMGCVYLVEDLHRGKERLALKTILEGSSSKGFERFCVEFTGLSRLQHPNIAAARDFGRIAATGEYFFTTEFVDGVDLYRATADAVTDQLVDVIAQTLRGLEFIHSHGFLHNDLKPSNVLVKTRAPAGASTNALDLTGGAETGRRSLGLVKIIDFGLFTTENTAWVDLLGTPHFLSPERIRGQPVDRRSDLYSLGLILYLLCARVFPFNVRDADAIISMHLDTDVPSLATHRPDLPPALIELVDRLTRKRTEDRFQSAAETLRFLEEKLGESIRGVAPEKAPPGLVSGNLFEREAELIHLEERFCTLCAAASDSPCVVLRGPAGIGKTRLVRELRGLVQVNGGAFVEISCRAAGPGLLPIAETLLGALETSGVRGVGEVRKAIPAQTDGTEGAATLAVLLECAVLKHAREMPLLILVDDFHAASEAARRFAFNLAHSASERLKAGVAKPKLLLVLASRSDAEQDPDLDRFPSIRLQPFSDKSAAAFVKQIFAQEEIPDEILATVVSCAQGVPGRLLELATDLVEGQSVHHSGARWLFPG